MPDGRRARPALSRSPPHLRLDPAVEGRVGQGLADWLGHASATITLSTYAHLMPADEDVARTVLDEALAPPADFPRTAGGEQAI